MLDQLLKADKDDTNSSPDEVTERHNFLRDCQERAAATQPVETTVRELLRHWGLASRDPAGADRVQADLENYGLHSDPNFAKVGLDSAIQLISAPSAEDQDDAASSDDGEVDNQSDEVGITLGNLPSATAGVVTIKPQASFDEAITMMLLNDFSQLPVMNGDREIKGAVTWQSIASAQHANTEAKLSEAIIEAPVFLYDTELIDVLTTLQDNDFLLVRNQARIVTGIVTTADVVKGLFTIEGVIGV